MRALLQRVSQASVQIDGQTKAAIASGLLIFLGVGKGDDHKDLDWLVQKILGLRIFPDEHGKMNRAVAEARGQLLVVSQFTLCASTRKGLRPDFASTAEPQRANELYQFFLEELEKGHGKPVCSGVFGAEMKVSLVNEGPVTFLLDSKNPD